MALTCIKSVCYRRCGKAAVTIVSAVFLMLLTLGGSAAARDAEPEQFVLEQIFVNRSAIFNENQSALDPLRRLVNRLHVTTRESVILTEIAVQPGRLISQTRVAEIERTLRRMQLFSDVSVKLVPVAGTSAMTLHIDTRDRLSIVAGASGSFVGGVGELGFTLGERNVAGYGDRFFASYTGNTDDELRGAISYQDVQFIDGRHKAFYSVGRTEDGPFYGLRFSRPFKALADKRSWTVLTESVNREYDYYQQGVSVAQIPEQRDTLSIDSYWRRAAGVRTHRLGLSLRYDDREFDPSAGSQAATIVAPDDSTRVYASLGVGIERQTGFVKIRGIDTLGYVQDLVMGSSAELRIGVAHQKYDGLDNAVVSPVVGAVLSASRRSTAGTFYRFTFNGSTTLKSISDGELDNRAWSVNGSARVFNKLSDRHTLAARLDYTMAEGGDRALPVQQTLGEDNGLRGYASRLLSGRERVRLNLEDRINLGWRLGPMDIGLLGFFDVGWVAEEEPSDSEVRRSAGVGLRLGSNQLLGPSVIRMDLAMPLDNDEDSSPLFSLSVGQVFGF